ncbi:MAG TPA: hypothetical protein VF712_13020 [Thermoleophilaceae bacterium]
MEELLALCCELVEAPPLGRRFLPSLGTHPGDRAVELRPDFLRLRLRQPHAAVGALDRTLDGFDGHVGCSQPVRRIRPMQKK